MSSKQNKKERIAQIDFLLKVMTEPVFAPETSSFDALNNTFSTEDNENLGMDRCGITMAVLNFRNLKTGHAENSDGSYALQSFMRNIQDYLPIKLRSKCWGKGNWALNKTGAEAHGASKEMLDKFDDLRDWLITFRTKIENDLSSKFIMGNKPQYLETLKRRFKENWSEKLETVNENHDTVDGSLSIDVKIEDA